MINDTNDAIRLSDTILDDLDNYLINNKTIMKKVRFTIKNSIHYVITEHKITIDDFFSDKAATWYNEVIYKSSSDIYDICVNEFFNSDATELLCDAFDYYELDDFIYRVANEIIKNKQINI